MLYFVFIILTFYYKWLLCYFIPIKWEFRGRKNPTLPIAVEWDEKEAKYVYLVFQRFTELLNSITSADEVSITIDIVYATNVGPELVNAKPCDRVSRIATRIAVRPVVYGHHFSGVRCIL